MHIQTLQQQIRERDYNQRAQTGYMLKLVEEVGELAEAIRKDSRLGKGEATQIKGTVDEELYDVLYYVLAIANLYEVDMERAVVLKEEHNRVRYNRTDP